MSDSPVTRPAAARVEWVDYAKGICIFFVVMLHVNTLVQDHIQATGWLEHVVRFARPFRMPDFFLIAGLFLANVIQRPWRLYLDRKVVHFVYFYALWMTIEFVGFDARHALREGTAEGGLALEYLRRYIDPSGPLWFIHMLPIFFVVTRLTRSVPWWIVWLAAATLHSLQIKTGWNVPDEFAARYVYFFSGYVFAPQVFRIAGWTLDHARAALSYLAVWGVTNALVIEAGWSKLPGVSLMLGFLGAIAVIFTAGLLSKISWTRGLRYMGEHSIVIYLGDFVVSVAMLRAFLPLVPDVGALALLVTVATIAGTLLLWRLVLRTPARFLYVRPSWLMLAGTARRPTAVAGVVPATPRPQSDLSG